MNFDIDVLIAVLDEHCVKHSAKPITVIDLLFIARAYKAKFNEPYVKSVDVELFKTVD